MALTDSSYPVSIHGKPAQHHALHFVHEEPSRVVMVESAEVWQEILKRAYAQGTIIAVHFSAEWCAPCKFIAPAFDELSRKYPDVIFLDVDVDEVKEIATKMDVKAMPTFVFIKGGEQAGRFVGANKEELEKRILHLSNSED
ncbi:hypothetical protein O6H91_01G121300 [Diphasiastrum complanatum]|uniref:Uncharacterized protein n=1 Tax=Diphasiastrum complanatum TaxID=34168 RepID=A0ACC2EVM2_DIPCM|nr:hypothetical protein O6H91_01G121300 [Diphasiastrum complanatum]